MLQYIANCQRDESVKYWQRYWWPTYHAPPHHCSYCLKAIATKPGIKQHIVQSPACHDHWEKLVEQTHFTASNSEDDQTVEETNDNAPPYEWVNEFNELDGPNIPLKVPEGHLVHQSCIDVVAGPPDLCKCYIHDMQPPLAHSSPLCMHPRPLSNPLIRKNH